MNGQTQEIYIVCSTDNNYAQHCGVMLSSLFQSNPDSSFVIYIFKSNLSIKNKSRINSIGKIYHHRIKYIEINHKELLNAPTIGHVSIETYYRLLIPKYLPDTVDKVLYLDVDMIARKKIDDLWNIDISNYALAACRNPNMIYNNKRLGTPEKSIYFNAGVLLLNLGYWRGNLLADKIVKYITEQGLKLKYWDQDALNVVLHDSVKIVNNINNVTEAFYMNPTSLLGEYSQDEIERIKQEAVIIHFTGESKPWHLENKHPMKSEYYKYLKMTPWRNYNPYWDKVKRVVNNRIISKFG
ncbi:MAG: glycosyltransferase family 8 protein [Saprospiraceae bacterium]